MNFQKRRISKKPLQNRLNQLSKNISQKNTAPNLNFIKKIIFNKVGLIACSILVLAFSAFAVYQYTPFKSLFTKTILKTIGSNIEKDNRGYTNILAVGIGGEGHSGSELTDTLILASINEKTNKVIMTSIPRDLYAKHPNIRSQRINSVYENAKAELGEEAGMKTLTDIVGDFTGLDVHYYIRIDFKGLVDVVNAVGGIEIFNEEDIYDPFYPGPNYTYQTFSLKRGLQVLDGETALKYARSRKTTNDFSRSNRQQQIILAIKEQALKLNILASPQRITNLYQSIEKNIGTNLTIREITTLGAIASDISRRDLIQVIFSDDPNSKGGFLYTPPRSLYGGAFVLLPADKSLSQIQTFINLHLDYPEFMKNPVPVDIFNGTKTTGLAGKTALIMQRFGFTTNQIKNLENRDIEVTETFIQTSEDKNSSLYLSVKDLYKTIKKTQKIDPPLPNPNQDGLPSTLKIIVGTDFINTLKTFDVYSSLAPIIQQALEENRAANEDLSTEIDPVAAENAPTELIPTPTDTDLEVIPLIEEGTDNPL